MKTKILTGALGYLLLISYGAILLHATYCFFVVGHWPSYNNPDPKTLPSRAFGMVVGILWLAAVASAALYPLTLIGLKFFRRAKTEKQEWSFPWHLKGFVAGLLLWAVDLKFIHLISWELD
jgi:hypothetical protein